METRVINSSREMVEVVEGWRKRGESIGCVPTMGYLHEGHLSLVRAARAENSKVVATIFVNPLQFGANEDLDRYPKSFESDRSALEKEGVDAIFAPSVEEIYPTLPLTFVTVERLTKNLCGRSRKNHFRGVATVVAKLFNLTKPHKAYFGQKDYQQCLVVKQMVSDLNFGIDIKMMPIVRDGDCLALSSRNVYLSSQERENALSLYRSLRWAQDEIFKGESSSRNVVRGISKIIRGAFGRIDYVEIVDPQTLERKEKIFGQVFIGLAVFFGSTRLIDNCLVFVKKGGEN